jgi:hypothetical protein
MHSTANPPPRLPMALAGALEQPAGMIARLDAALAFHPLLGAALGVRAWLDQGGERQPLRAALALYWQRRRLTTLPCPLLTGAAALDAEIPWRTTNGTPLGCRAERCRQPAPRFAGRGGDRQPDPGLTGLRHHAWTGAGYRDQQAPGCSTGYQAQSRQAR